jgi:phospholipase C
VWEGPTSSVWALEHRPTADSHGRVEPLGSALPSPGEVNSLISYGFRVPLLVISPWVKQGPLQDGGYASHEFYSHASFARFVEWAFRLPTLGAADDLSTYTANEPTPGNLRDFFDFSGTPKRKLVLPVRTCPRLTRAQKAYIATSSDD